MCLHLRPSRRPRHTSARTLRAVARSRDRLTTTHPAAAQACRCRRPPRSRSPSDLPTTSLAETPHDTATPAHACVALPDPSSPPSDAANQSSRPAHPERPTPTLSPRAAWSPVVPRTRPARAAHSPRSRTAPPATTRTAAELRPRPQLGLQMPPAYAARHPRALGELHTCLRSPSNLPARPLDRTPRCRCDAAPPGLGTLARTACPAEPAAHRTPSARSPLYLPLASYAVLRIPRLASHSRARARP